MNPFIIKALAGLGLGASGAGGLIVGKKKGEAETKKIFDEYNKEENEALANDAFISGVEYAMGKQSNLNHLSQKQIDSIASDAFNDELKNIGAMIDKKPSKSEYVGNTLLGGWMGPIQHAIHAKPGKGANAFAATLGREAGMGLAGGAAGAISGSGVGFLVAKMLKANPKLGTEVGAGIGSGIGSIVGAGKGYQMARKALHKRDTFKK